MSHYCYDCKESFHDSNLQVQYHKGCTADRFAGICVDGSEFREKEINLFNPETTKHEVFCIRNGYAFIGYKIPNGNFHFEIVPYTEPEWSRQYQVKESFL